MADRIFNAIILNDYTSEIVGTSKHYASNVRDGLKTLETREQKFDDKWEGDMVICCGKKSPTRSASKALCIVHWGKAEKMADQHEEAAMIANNGRKYVYPLTNRRLFSREFDFTKCYVSGSFQSIFQIRIPDDVSILEATTIDGKQITKMPTTKTYQIN